MEHFEHFDWSEVSKEREDGKEKEERAMLFFMSEELTANFEFDPWFAGC